MLHIYKMYSIKFRFFLYFSVQRAPSKPTENPKETNLPYLRMYKLVAFETICCRPFAHHLIMPRLAVLALSSEAITQLKFHRLLVGL